jgi:hypothetical protein
VRALLASSAVAVVAVLMASGVVGASVQERHASRTATRICLARLGAVGFGTRSGGKAVGPEGDLYLAFRSPFRAALLSFFPTEAAAQHNTVSHAKIDRILSLRTPYRVLNVMVGWGTKPGPPTANEKAAVNGCINRSASP